MPHKFRKGDRVQFETKFGVVRGTVQSNSIGWNPSLVRITVDSKSRIGTVHDAEWVEEGNVSFIFKAEKVEFT